MEHHRRAEVVASFMGIIPEINRIWITIDNLLYLWDYTSRSEDAYVVYEGISEIIYSVTCVTPKSDTFHDSVAYLLVVITPVEISLLALVGQADTAQDEHRFALSSIQPTKYTTASDNLTFLAVSGIYLDSTYYFPLDDNQGLIYPYISFYHSIKHRAYLSSRK